MGVVKGKLAPTLFSSTDIGYHKSVRKAVNPFFTLSRVATYEPFVEKTIATFMREMHTRFANRQGPSGSVDIHTWLSFYTFDSISELTYSKPHGFMKHGGDMYGIIEWVADFLKYGFIVRIVLLRVLTWVSKPTPRCDRSDKCHHWTVY